MKFAWIQSAAQTKTSEELGAINKISIGCLVETKVNEDKFQSILTDPFMGWKCLHNYSHHRLGRIWVCWSDEVDVEPVLVSSQSRKNLEIPPLFCVFLHLHSLFGGLRHPVAACSFPGLGGECSFYSGRFP